MRYNDDGSIGPEEEDGMGFAGLVPSAQEKREERNRDIAEIGFKVSIMTDSAIKQLVSMLRNPALPDLKAIEKELTSQQSQISDLQRRLDWAELRLTMIKEHEGTRLQIRKYHGDQLYADGEWAAHKRCAAIAREPLPDES